jgi:hypothetical protein
MVINENWRRKMKATQQLKDEHEGIKLMLNIMETICDELEKGKQLDINHYEKILEFIKGFADKCLTTLFTIRILSLKKLILGSSENN